MTTIRDVARELLERATGGTAGVRSTDPIYEEVTGGRDPGPGYSSCVDLPHWMLSQLTDAPWLEVDPSSGYQLAKFWSGPWRNPKGCEVPRAGDTWIVWSIDADGIKSRTHALVVSSFDPATGELESWDYGQSSTDIDRWSSSQIEGIRKKRHIECKGGVWELDDGRTLRMVLTLDEALGRSADESASDLPSQVVGRTGSAWVWLLVGGAAAWTAKRMMMRK